MKYALAIVAVILISSTSVLAKKKKPPESQAVPSEPTKRQLGSLSFTI
jgi:hypothetical protein